MELHRQLLLVLLLQLVTALVWAEPRVSIEPGQVKLTDFRVGYHIDASGTLSLEEVRTLPFRETGNRTSLGTDARVT